MRRVNAKFVPRLLTDDQKENRVEISQELLANANDNKNFLKNIITGDETWVYGYDVETKMQSSLCLGKGSPRPTKSTDDSVKGQGVVGCVLRSERHCPSWICTTWSDGKQTVVPGSFRAFEGCCTQKEASIVGEPHLDVAPRQCTGSRVAPHPQLSGKTSDIRCAPLTHFERTSFPHHREDSGKCDKKTARHHRKCVPGSIPTMEETLGTVYRQ